MVFSSFEFLFEFLPFVLAGYFLIIRFTGSSSLVYGFLVLASFLFYASWNPFYLALLASTIIFNYVAGIAIVESKRRAWRADIVTLTAVGANLGLLGYFKYSALGISLGNQIFSLSLPIPELLLPLGISFFTFQKIAYLVDVHRYGKAETSILRFSLFVSFFPQLIAGPIVHPGDILPQLKSQPPPFNLSDLSVGLTIFIFGLGKKVLLADNIAPYANDVFRLAGEGTALTVFEAWTGALAYSLQIYFDFSGYSDMAIGLARIFAIKLPVNFASPYKAVSIIDFWRTWHMTLSNWLRDYLYIPLGGGRRGEMRRYVNLMLTMFLGGLWHGASLTFVAWGGLHGLYLAVNHLSRSFFPASPAIPVWFSRGITFLAVVFAWVLFRAPDMPSALSMMSAMVGGNGISLSAGLAPYLGLFFGSVIDFTGMFKHLASSPVETLLLLGVLLMIVWLAPNTQTVMRDWDPYLRATFAAKLNVLSWRPSVGWAFASALVFALSAGFSLVRVSEFIYFNF